jgi:hypothetical protein
MEEGFANGASVVLKNVWKMSVLRSGYSYWYTLTDEMFYFYHVAHMAKHFEIGGCGIKPLVDLLLLDSLPTADFSKRYALLEEGNLLKFAKASRNLSAVWFGNKEHDFVSKQMEDYIVRGGVYGTNVNRIMVQQQKSGGRLRYALSRIFLPYDVIKFHFPILEKHRWLTPLMQACRWCKLMFGGRAKSSFNELKYNQNISSDEASVTKQFLSSIGL